MFGRKGNRDKKDGCKQTAVALVQPRGKIIDTGAVGITGMKICRGTVAADRLH